MRNQKLRTVVVSVTSVLSWVSIALLMAVFTAPSSASGADQFALVGTTQLPPPEVTVTTLTHSADGTVHRVRSRVGSDGSFVLPTTTAGFSYDGGWDCCYPDNPAYTEITETQWSALHLSKLWTFTTWIKWHWKGSLDIVAKNWSMSTDPAWSWDGIIKHDAYYYAWRSGSPNSGYYMMKQGSFSGPALGNYNAHCYPKLYIWVNTDGGARMASDHGC